MGSGSWINLSVENAPYEASLLNLDISKAKTYLNWLPVWNIDTAITKTVEWYKDFDRRDPYDICVEQIKACESQLE